MLKIFEYIALRILEISGSKRVVLTEAQFANVRTALEWAHIVVENEPIRNREASLSHLEEALEKFEFTGMNSLAHIDDETSEDIYSLVRR